MKFILYGLVLAATALGYTLALDYIISLSYTAPIILGLSATATVAVFYLSTRLMDWIDR